MSIDLYFKKYKAKPCMPTYANTMKTNTEDSETKLEKNDLTALNKMQTSYNFVYWQVTTELIDLFRYIVALYIQ